MLWAVDDWVQGECELLGDCDDGGEDFVEFCECCF